MTTRAALAALTDDLNEPQRQAVMHRDGPLLVLAGPGSGKTRVITRRAAYLVHGGVSARSVLAITFTNKAADEMRKRIAALGVDRGMWVYTFHALGARLLHEFGALARVQPNFTIYDEDDRKKLVRDALEQCGIPETFLRPDDAIAEISNAKNRLETPALYGAAQREVDDAVLARVYEKYEQLLEQSNAVDFDDLLMRVAVVLRDYPDVAERLNIRFRYLLIDEYQDTNHAQYLIARCLSQHHRNICATGDPDQSIYGWRGADVGNILEFERDYPEARIVRLEQNYRSTPQILAVADALIARNHRRREKTLWTEVPAGAPVVVWKFGEDQDEAGEIADTIRALRGAGRSCGDIAVFYRVNALSRRLEEALRVRGIPYRIARGLEFYNRREIRDALAYVRVLVNPADDVALLRIINSPARGIGKTTVERLAAAAAQAGSPIAAVLADPGALQSLRSGAKAVQRFAALLRELRAATEGVAVAAAVEQVLALSGLEASLADSPEAGGEDRLANLAELVSAARSYEQGEDVEEPTLRDFLHRVALVNDQDAVDATAGQVNLMTLHAAKGLEFPVVFLVGLEQGLLPHERAVSGDGDLEEERRLCFVGITRAREQLYITHCQQRLVRGTVTPRAASQFLRELDDGSTQWQSFRLLRPARPQWSSGAPAETDDESAAPRRRGEFGPPPDEADRIIEFDDVTPSGPPGAARTAAGPAYADWTPGTLVKHDTFGVGRVVWVRPEGANTRAAIHFAGHGEKVFILELAPVRLLMRLQT